MPGADDFPETAPRHGDPEMAGRKFLPNLRMPVSETWRYVRSTFSKEPGMQLLLSGRSLWRLGWRQA